MLEPDAHSPVPNDRTNATANATRVENAFPVQQAVDSHIRYAPQSKSAEEMDAVQDAPGEVRFNPGRPADAPSSGVLSNGASRAAVPPISPRLHDNLAAAVTAWWRSGALPSDALLRDGLLALEAGVALEPSQRTLLARTALVRGKGYVTALRHLDDPERVASLVHEAWMGGLLGEAALNTLLHDRRLGGEWRRFLANDLRSALSPYNVPAARRAEIGLQRLAEAIAVEQQSETGDAYSLLEESSVHRSARWFYWMVLALVALMLAIWYWQTRTPEYGDVIHVDAGMHRTTDAAGIVADTALSAFVIDRTEVTNRRYAACYAAGACPYPASLDVPGHRDYFLDEQFADHPVVNLDWAAADAFCRWRKMRLPTAAEFEVAARYAPLTNRYYRYPWGDLFSSAFVISGESHDAPARIGSRSPQGDSPLGGADLVGNVSEWTATSPIDAPQLAFIKGGSWRDRVATDSPLNPAIVQPLPKGETTPWLGFRCAVTVE